MLSDVVEALHRATSSSLEFNVDRGPHFPRDQSSASPRTRLIGGRAFCGFDLLVHLIRLTLNADRIDEGPQDHESIAQLSSHALGFVSSSSGPLSNTDPALAEQALDILRSLVVRFSSSLDDQDLIVIAAYTDRKRTWTTVNAELYAREILERSLDDVQKQAFITSVVLEGFIRPLFSRNSSSRITSTGRKAHFADDSQDRFTPGASADTNDAKSWKTTQAYAITVFSWAVEQSHVGYTSDNALVEKSWPLFTPVLLALLDDPDTEYKARGLAVLGDFLVKCPGKVLVQTGLGDVFEQSVFPTLLSLPTLTPEKESLLLLGPAYSAIIRLAKIQFPGEGDRDKKKGLLTRLLREGVFMGYWQASDYVGIVELLARQTTSIVNELGFLATAHLKELLSMISAIMTDPFLASHPSSIQAAAQAFGAILIHQRLLVEYAR
ncbi:hypothetical protein CPAR01_15895 [Colletotrichum paranaense]|uniref:Uncharacterized protein n=1 Tax=Colletotrichum paranaense TaxID=1914294 RepID=A0ABQ9RY54_9PEZI|nr:uncharacterized protein CPAR01_15895 [Colletotrichum paranaense]KAK1518246.1 hypothetical protein CPAR01_15895 [Colletotrichum paranaense]